MNKVVYIHVT